ncbi:Pal1 cell morphology [Metarhizium album ARSEF 1941]|uniref:Pal1 cell morphology n=1 Tax=Metarhizium album (strain ARSEF 1941) TaxID=1081103 RepID=A0A0B2WM49_METAS|nr:Pal1 cell morphology [Metarhizium album ARSEF 1941]KHN94729.1 Pal1 cell morphology [Metarhizium album ARSEF 1941]
MPPLVSTAASARTAGSTGLVLFLIDCSRDKKHGSRQTIKTGNPPESRRTTTQSSRIPQASKQTQTKIATQGRADRMGIRSMFRRGDGESKNEKKLKYDTIWAREYLLDPLNAPEPSQETGLGTSHINPYIAAARERVAEAEAQAIIKETRRHVELQKQATSPRRPQHRYPTPPPSASPTRCSCHQDLDGDFGHDLDPFATSYFPCHFNLRRRPSTDSDSDSTSTPASTPRIVNLRKSIASAGHVIRAEHNNHHHSRRTHSFYEPPPSPSRRSHVGLTVDTLPSIPRGCDSHSRSHSRPVYPPTQLDSALDKARRICQDTSNYPDPYSQPRRKIRPRERFPGDMSHRPLDMLKLEARAADRPRRHRKRISDTDTIDALDTIGGAYHHGGPYDATLISRNLNKKYSPVAAVRESNMEAIRATPRENIMDSLIKHVPLQGVASIPSGARDSSGRLMRYREGADLMREPDAEGGAYKRWDGLQYHPDDLKGKGEPSFTLERDLKRGKRHRQHLSEADAFEMRPSARVFSRQAGGHSRSVSHNGEGSSSGVTFSDNADGVLRRTYSSGKKFGEGLKRRFGGLHRKEEMPSVTMS